MRDLNSTPRAERERAFIRKAANTVRYALRRTKSSQKDLAERMGTSQAAVSQWVTATRNMTLSSLFRMLDALNFEIEIKIKPRRKT